MSLLLLGGTDMTKWDEIKIGLSLGVILVIIALTLILPWLLMGRI